MRVIRIVRLVRWFLKLNGIVLFCLVKLLKWWVSICVKVLKFILKVNCRCGSGRIKKVRMFILWRWLLILMVRCRCWIVVVMVV